MNSSNETQVTYKVKQLVSDLLRNNYSHTLLPPHRTITQDTVKPFSDSRFPTEHSETSHLPVQISSMLIPTSCSPFLLTHVLELWLFFFVIVLFQSWHFISGTFISFLKEIKQFLWYKEQIKWSRKKKERKGGGTAYFPSMMNKQMQKLSHQVPHFKTSNGAIAVFPFDNWNYMERLGRKLNYAICNCAETSSFLANL